MIYRSSHRTSRSVLVCVIALLCGPLHAQRQADKDEFRTSSQRHNEINLIRKSNPKQGEGLFMKRDGTCIFRTVYDDGYTHVTIDAKGTLFAQKNDVVEDVEVPCPSR